MSTNLAVFRAGLTSLALLTGGGSAYTWYQAQPVRYRDYWNVPDPEPIPPPIRNAGRYTAAIDEQRAACEAEMAALSALIDKERPGEFDLAKEIVTADAMRAYVEKLLRLGEATAASLVRMEPPARKLDLLIAAAPAHYRESAAQMRRYVEETARENIKKNYMMLADICEAKAVAAERHRDDVREYLNSDLLDYMRETNVFLERMLGVLNNGLAPDDLQEAARFRDMLKELVTKHEYLSNTLRVWRARVRGEAPPAAPEPRNSEDTSGSKTVACEAKSERGAEPAAAPLPRAMQVATLKLFGGVLHELHERTRWLSTPYGGAHLEVPETDQAVGLKLRATRAEFIGQPPPPEPERPADSKPAVPEPPKPEPVRVQPAERQALAAPQPEPPRTGRDTGWGDYSAEAKEAREDYNYFRAHGSYPPVTSARPQPWVATGAASAGGLYPARWTPAAEIERDRYLAARGDAGAFYRLRSRALRGY